MTSSRNPSGTRLSHLVRFAARILTGSTYFLLGLDAARLPGKRVDQAAPMLAAMRSIVPLPADDELIVRGNGAAQALGGALLVVGKAQRMSAVALAASLIPTTMAGHAFWVIEDSATRKQQRVQFLKNMAMIGGLLFAFLDQR
jgi:putative oxidoreductase